MPKGDGEAVHEEQGGGAPSLMPQATGALKAEGGRALRPIANAWQVPEVIALPDAPRALVEADPLPDEVAAGAELAADGSALAAPLAPRDHTEDSKREASNAAGHGLTRARSE